MTSDSIFVFRFDDNSDKFNILHRLRFEEFDFLQVGRNPTYGQNIKIKLIINKI